MNLCLWVQIERLKAQLSAQETSNRSQAEELEKLKEQLEQLRKEEIEYKHKVGVVRKMIATYVVA